MTMTISGTVSVDGVPARGVTLHLCRSDTGAKLLTTISAAAGDPIVEGWTQVAGEGGTFAVAAGDVVRYGADIRWAENTYGAAGSHVCNTSEFGGDPAAGTLKTCQLRILSDETFDEGGYRFVYDGPYVGDAYVVALNPATGQNHQVRRVVIAA